MTISNISTFKLVNQGFLVTVLTTSLLGCFHSEDEENNKKTEINSFKAETFDTVIATAAPDYSSGAHTYISSQYIYETQNDLDASASDLKAVVYGEFIYRLGKFGLDHVTKYHINEPEKPIWQYSTNDSDETISGNPHDMVFVNEQKAYITRYGSNTVWVVNPSADNETEFKIGELDLSDYADADSNGIVEMSDAIVVNDKLFIVMQRLVNFAPDDATAPYIAVFDTNTDTEIDTQTNNENLNGIALAIKNPGTIQYLNSTNKLYLSAIGRYENPWNDPITPAEYTGGIMEIDPDTYSATLILDDGDQDNHPYGQIADIAILDESQGYFIGYIDGTNDNLFSFNPSTGEVNDEPVLKDQSLKALKIDSDENLWVANRSSHGITIIDTRTNKVLKQSIETNIDPTTIDFSSNGSEIKAVATTAASDFSSGAHAFINMNRGYSTSNDLDASASDITVVSYKDHFYRIGKFGLDFITKFHSSAPDKPIWQFSTMDATDTMSSNPYDMVFASDTKAYIVRYGSNKIWIVNPSAETESEFKLGELDLSAYADTVDNFSEMADALIIEDKLYILMQRLENFAPTEELAPYIAIFDTKTDTELSIGANTEGLNGIALTVKNPKIMQYVASNNSIYVSAVGKHAINWLTPPLPAEYTGGIETIDLSDFSTNLLIDDGDENNHPYGQIDTISIANATQGYFIGYVDGVSDNLFSFNPTTGEVNTTPLIANNSISDINIDPAGNLWVGNRTSHGVTIIDTANNEVIESHIDTNIDPTTIVFVDNQ